MTIAIYQTSLSGHHGAHARAIAAAAAERGWQSKVIIPASAHEHPALRSIVGIVGESNVIYTPFKIPTFVEKSKLSLIRFHFAQHKLASKSINLVKHDCDLVYIPTLDVMDQAIRVLGLPSTEIPTIGMCIRIKFHLKPKSTNALRNSINNQFGEASIRSLLSSRGLRGITTIDPLLAEFAKTRKNLATKIFYVPEIGMDCPPVTRQRARDVLGFKNSDRVILVFGQITGRKGLAELTSAIDAVTCDMSSKVLVVGEIHEEMRRFLASPIAQKLLNKGALIVKPGFADDDLQACAFAAADAVWVAYIGHPMMSGVFYQAICSGIPIIAPNYGVMNWLAAKYSLGPIVDPANANATGKQISDLLENSELWQQYASNAASLAEAHRPIQFGRGVCNAIAAVYPGSNCL